MPRPLRQLTLLARRPTELAKDKLTDPIKLPMAAADEDYIMGNCQPHSLPGLDEDEAALGFGCESSS